MIENDIKEVYFSKEELHEIVKRLGAQISKDYEGKNLTLVSILKGSVIFMADLMREITVPCEIDFMCVSSYGTGTKSSGTVKIIKDLDINLEGKDLVIAFNSKYLTDILRAVNDDFVYMYFNSSISPCVIKSYQGDQYLYLLLPIRINS